MGLPPPVLRVLAAGKGVMTFQMLDLTLGQGAWNVHTAAAVRLGGPGVLRASAPLPTGAVRRVLPGAAAARGAAGR